MDFSEPPRIVFEQPESCADAARAEELLRRTIAPSHAPRPAWTVTMRVRAGGGSLRAEGEITDDRSAPVAHRAFSESTRECAALARAVGVWASLVLDAEVERARSAPVPRLILAHAEADAPPPWPEPSLNEPPSPEHDWYLHHAGRRTFELGAATFLMAGTGASAVAGPALFSVVEVGGGVFLRPTLAFGRTVESLVPWADSFGTFGATRLDTCLRIPGLYKEGFGIQLDACAGTDLGFLRFDPAPPPSEPQARAAGAHTIPYLSLGPALGLRGELGGRLAAELRAIAGVNALRESVDAPGGLHVEPPLLAGRAELGLSWRLR